MINYLNPYIELKPSKGKGLGVFALHDLDANTLIEIAPVLVLSDTDTKKIHQTLLHDYYFSWGEQQNESAIALGYVSIYNHSFNANCYYECDFEERTIHIFTKEIIRAEEELFIDYTMGEKKQLWFKVL